MEICLLPRAKRDEINRALSPYGVSLQYSDFEAGGSKVDDDNLWWFNIYHGCAAHYAEKKVAQILMDAMGVDEIVMDGKL